MAADGGESWETDLEELRMRMAELEARQKVALDDLRERIAGIERKRAGVVKDDAKVPVKKIPVPVVTKVEAPVTRVEKMVMPPPLPREVERVELPEARVEEKEGGFELQLGRVWLVRFGIVLLLTGLVLLGNFAYRNWVRDMPNGVRLLGLFLCAVALAETGRRLAAKTALRKPGEVILAGGLAFFYYCTFAAHHVQRLKVIESPVLAAVLLLGAAGLVVGVSWLRNAKATAVLGLLLASYSTTLQPVGWLSCVSNVILAGAGLALMLRPGWAGPGVASMSGTYAAFFGWQIMGAAGVETKDPSVMWFLVPVWVIFALPGLLERFNGAMGDRARAWFAGGNNAAFFVLFSLLWVSRHGWGDYWVVCAVFGAVLLALGVIGRRRNEIAGGVNSFQGLALGTLAMVVKLEGFHLVLGLGFESLALAFAFAKFRTRSELVFCWLAAAGAMVMGISPRAPEVLGLGGAGVVPVWSAGIAALLVAAAALVVRAGGEKGESEVAAVARPAAGIVFFFAVALGVVGWGWWLPQPWPAPVMASVAVGMTALMFVLERRLAMPEVGFGGLAFLGAAAWRGYGAEEVWVLPMVGAFALAGAWLWHWWERRADDGSRALCVPELHGWIYPAVVAGAAWLTVDRHAGGTPLAIIGWLGGVALALLAFAVFAKTERLAPYAALLNAAGLFFAADVSSREPACVTAFALGMLGVLRIGGKGMPGWWGKGTAWVLRGTAFLGTCLFWQAFAPEFGGDGLAVTAILLLAVAIWRKVPAMAEVWGFLGLSVLWLLMRFGGKWSEIGEQASWRGWAVVLALWGLVVWTSFATRGRDRTPLTVAGWAASMLGSVWATQMLVWRHDWHAVSVLWTVLGFALVSGGLWLRLVMLRQAGFALLAMAVGKVFIVDVWDFNAFMRVVAFIVLGGAMILLGLFYNRFAPVLKKLLDDESDARR